MCTYASIRKDYKTYRDTLFKCIKSRHKVMSLFVPKDLQRAEQGYGKPDTNVGCRLIDRGKLDCR